MDCRELEERLEALLDGELDELERRRCARHLEGCPRCRELTEPFSVAATPPDDLVGSVLARTSGSPCGQAEERLCGWVDGRLEGADRELLASHLDSCHDCQALAAALVRLRAELPRLAELRPDPGFVAEVLAATLPLGVRLRRWWRAAWPAWVRRPRFASEAAFVATMVLVLVFAPGSPLGAVPTRALELVRADPATRLEAPVAALEQSFTSRVRKPLGQTYRRGEREVRTWAQATWARGRAAADGAVSWIGTRAEEIASLWGSARETASDGTDAAPVQDQERP